MNLKSVLFTPFVLLSLLFIQTCSQSGGSGERDKPNLLFIWTDEQQPFTMAKYGNDRIITPNLNKLADESIVFLNTYVTQPVCTPSRSSTMTGLYPHANGCYTNNIPLAENVPCFPEIVGDPEYRTAYFGKWHLGDEIYPQCGFEEWAAIEDTYIKYYSGGRDRSDRSSYHHWLLEKGYKPDENGKYGKVFSRKYAASLPLEHSKPAFLEERSIDFLKRNKDNPFILYVNFLEPHMPFTGPLDTLYSPGDVYLPESFGHVLDESFPASYRKKQASIEKQYGATEKEIRELIARYWGLVTEVDMSVGAILKELDDLGLSKNTVVVYTSDHGDMMGAHNLVQKGLVFEESAKVPLMIRYPERYPESDVIETRISLIDIVPTLLDLMNRPAPAYLQGKSLVPLVEGKRGPDYVFTEWNSDSRISRTVISPGGMKLCINKEEKNMLFDLEKDPLEMTNLIDRPDYSDEVKKLTGKIFEWQQETGDTLKLSIND